MRIMVKRRSVTPAWRAIICGVAAAWWIAGAAVFMSLGGRELLVPVAALLLIGGAMVWKAVRELCGKPESRGFEVLPSDGKDGLSSVEKF